MNEVDKFFSELPSEAKQVADVFNDKPPVASQEVAEGTTEIAPEEGEGRKNRRHRRLEEALQRERESNIALNARLQSLTETERFSKAIDTSEMPAEWVALYGTTPESEKAWHMQEKLLAGYADRIREETLQEFESRQTQVVQEQKKYESLIDTELENLEDQYNVDLTSDSPKARKSRREFLEMVQGMSPKDDSGNITDYADFDSVFQVYQKTNERTDDSINRRKELAARSMQKSGQGSTQPTQTITPGFNGWRKDYGL